MKAQIRLSAVQFAILSTTKQALVCKRAGSLRQRVHSTVTVIHWWLKTVHMIKKKKKTNVSNADQIKAALTVKGLLHQLLVLRDYILACRFAT